MNNKVNYKLIGLTVLFGFFMIFGFTYWLLKPSSKDEVQKYLIFFNESVSGLNINAPVKYRGISVGKVVDLRINPANIEQVQATVEILKSTPIKETTVAKLTAQGITGLTYINLSLGDNNAPLLKVKQGEKYPIIQSVPSLFKNVEKSLGGLSTQLSDMLEKANAFLNDANRKQIQRTLQHTANILEHVDKLLDDKTVQHLQASATNIDKFTMQLTELAPQMDKFIAKSILWEHNTSASFAGITQSYLDMGITMDNMGTSFANVQKDVHNVSLNIIPTLNETLHQIQNSMIEFNELMQEYKRSPSDILFKETNAKRGPGEK